jgi:predicted negative regulator of RcsB-dependent stress response
MDQTDEYEQGERVRLWLRNNGSSLIGGIALGLACLAGWQWWQAKQEQGRHAAAMEFHEFSVALAANEEAKAKAHLSVLNQQYPDLPYPALAALRQADALQAAGKTDEAVAALDAVKGEGVDPALIGLARLRAARALVAGGKGEEALKRLDAALEAAYPALAAEIRGDAELALGRRDAARDAYAKALASLDLGAPTRPIVELKLTDAGGTPAAEPEA